MNAHFGFLLFSPFRQVGAGLLHRFGCSREINRDHFVPVGKFNFENLWFITLLYTRDEGVCRSIQHRKEFVRQFHSSGSH